MRSLILGAINGLDAAQQVSAAVYVVFDSPQHKMMH
jgi:hypothetical protein